MKQMAVFLLASIFTLHAQDNTSTNAPSASNALTLLEPCDFSKGLSGWHGDGNLSNANGNSNPLADQPDGPVTLDIVLNSSRWSKIYQNFSTKYPTLNITVQYKLSGDLVFSDKAEDYENVTNAINYNGWVPIKAEVGTFAIMVSDFSRHLITWNAYKPTLADDKPRTLVFKLDQVDTQGENKCLTLAFPPGSGKVSIINAVAIP